MRGFLSGGCGPSDVLCGVGLIGAYEAGWVYVDFVRRGKNLCVNNSYVSIWRDLV